MPRSFPAASDCARRFANPRPVPNPVEVPRGFQKVSDFRRLTGRFPLLRIEEPGASTVKARIVFMPQTETGSIVRIDLGRVDRREQHRVERVLFTRGGGKEPRGVGIAETLDRAPHRAQCGAQFVRRAVAADGCGGRTRVADEPSQVFRKGGDLGAETRLDCAWWPDRARNDVRALVGEEE